MCWGLGYSLLSLFSLGKNRSKIEKYVMNIGIGLGVFPILSVILNTLKIPLAWYVFLIIAFIVPAIDLFRFLLNGSQLAKKEKTKKIFKLTKTNLALVLVFMIFAIHLFVYLEGAFTFPYLENGDPWSHADVSQYIAEQKSYSIPADDWKILHYTEPYPPTFAVMNAMLYQINPDLKWVLKFFNSFLISLGILFFYFFMKRIMKCPLRSAFATFLLAAVPCYLSHFIFAASLGVTLFFPAFYAFTQINKNKRWLYVAGIISASIFVVQPITAGVFGIIAGLYWILGVILYKNLRKHCLYALILGVLLSWLYYIPTFIKFGFFAFANKLGFQMMIGGQGDSSGGVIYSFKDYLISPLANKIDQATGFGAFFFIALLLCLVFFIIAVKKLYDSSDKERSRWIFLSIIIFFMTFMASQSNRFAYKFFPHRIWAYMAIAAVIILAFGIFSLLRSFPIRKEARYVILIVFIIGVILTSSVPKYKVQTSYWPPDYGYFHPIQKEGGVSSPELTGYLWMEKNVPWKSKSMVLCWEADQFAAGVNMMSQTADKEIREFKASLSEKSANDIISFAKQKDYDYILVGISCITKKVLSQEETQKILSDFSVSDEVKTVYSDKDGMFILKLV